MTDVSTIEDFSKARHGVWHCWHGARKVCLKLDAVTGSVLFPAVFQSFRVDTLASDGALRRDDSQ